MKLFYITNARIPTEKAHGVQIMKSCEAFADAGHHIELIAPERDTQITRDPFDFYGVRHNFSITKIPCFDAFRFETYLGRFSFLLQSISFLTHLRKVRVPSDVLVYTRNAEIAWLFSKRGYNVAFEAHAWPESKWWVYRRLLRAVQFIICNSKGTDAEFEKHGFHNTLVAPNGVDLAQFKVESRKSKIEELKRQLGLPRDKKIVMYTGHLYAWKGADVVMKVADAFRADKGVLFALVGGTQQDVEKYQKIIKDKKLTNVLLLGHKEQRMIPDYLACADVFLLPNIPASTESERYTSPIKMFEYMASGKPIVASDLPSIREVLNESNALLAEPNNAGAFVEKIKKAFIDSTLVANITTRALADVQKYTWQKRVQTILGFLSI